MNDDVIQLGGKKRNTFLDNIKEILPEGGNLNRLPHHPHLFRFIPTGAGNALME